MTFRQTLLQICTSLRSKFWENPKLYHIPVCVYMQSLFFCNFCFLNVIKENLGGGHGKRRFNVIESNVNVLQVKPPNSVHLRDREASSILYQSQSNSETKNNWSFDTSILWNLRRTSPFVQGVWLKIQKSSVPARKFSHSLLHLKLAKHHRFLAILGLYMVVWIKT